MIATLKRQDATTAKEVLGTSLQPLFEAKRSAIQSVAQRAAAQATADEQQVATIVASRMTVQILIGMVVLASLGGFTFWLRCLADEQEARDRAQVEQQPHQAEILSGKLDRIADALQEAV